VDSVARNGDYWVKSHTGRQATQRDTGRRTEDWILEVEALGAGEVVLNCMDQDGVRQGYDVVQLQKMRGLIHVPLIASGGAGATEDFIEVFAEANVSGALAASVFHRGILTIEDVKLACQKANIPIRTHFKEE
jgi:cyclase